MTDFHVEIVRLGKIEKHPNADALDITYVHGENGYPCIVKKDSFKEGDLAVYIPIETTLPDRPEFAFLSASEHRRLKAKKLRGFFSMGLVIPVPSDIPDAVEGMDVAERLGITKFEPKQPSGQYSKVMGGDCEADPEHFIFHKYTDIEPLRRNSRVLNDGEEVILTEKCHGCFASGTKVTMADGTKKCIEHITVGEYVLGLDSYGLVVPSQVIQTWSDTKSDWVDVKFTRKKVGRGNYYGSFTCTPNHQIATGDVTDIIWKNAIDLTESDSLLLNYFELGIPYLQKQILTGILLGDGYLSIRPGDAFAYIMWGHKQEDSGYMEWISRGLGDLYHKSEAKREYTSGYGSQMLRDRTTASGSILRTFQDFKCKVTDKKIVPEWIVQELSPLSIAFWFMDDGSIGSRDGEEQDCVASFATCGFTVDECQLLCKGLAKFNIDSKVTSYIDRGKNRNRIVLNSANADKLFILIAPYIPPCMSRKLPARYQGGAGWLPDPEVPQRYSQIVKQKLISVSKTQLKNNCSYDLTTETGNFFAHDLLVHNSNYRAVHDGTRLWVGSRQQIKKRPEEINDQGPVWWRLAKELDLETKLAKCPNHIFYGEVFGPGIQDLTYGQTKPTLRIFDVLDTATNLYVDHDEAVRLTALVGLEMVPHLYRGPWKPAELLPLCEGKTTLGEVHCREGFVVKPVKERWDHRVGRVILKMVGESYHLRKEK